MSFETFVKKTAGRVKDGAVDAASSIKVSIKIHRLEDEVEELYAELGEVRFDELSNDNGEKSEKSEKLFEKILSLKSEIEKITEEQQSEKDKREEQKSEKKSKAICKQCQKKLSPKFAYCPNCGEKQDYGEKQDCVECCEEAAAEDKTDTESE